MLEINIYRNNSQNILSVVSGDIVDGLCVQMTPRHPAG